MDLFNRLSTLIENLLCSFDLGFREHHCVSRQWMQLAYFRHSFHESRGSGKPFRNLLHGQGISLLVCHPQVFQQTHRRLPFGLSFIICRHASQTNEKPQPLPEAFPGGGHGWQKEQAAQKRGESNTARSRCPRPDSNRRSPPSEGGALSTGPRGLGFLPAGMLDILPTAEAGGFPSQPGLQRNFRPRLRGLTLHRAANAAPPRPRRCPRPFWLKRGQGCSRPR